MTKEQDKAFVARARDFYNRDAVEARRQERKRRAPEPEEEESEGEDEMAFDDWFASKMAVLAQEVVHYQRFSFPPCHPDNRFN